MPSRLAKPRRLVLPPLTDGQQVLFTFDNDFPKDQRKPAAEKVLAARRRGKTTTKVVLEGMHVHIREKGELDWHPVDGRRRGSPRKPRFGRLFGDKLPADVYYTRCARPLTREIERLRRIIRRQAIDFAICDSIGFATQEPPETAASALAYFQAVRQMGIGTLSVAHVNRSETGDQKPYGSAFFHNSARATWFVKATDSTAGLRLGIFNRKNNLAERQAPFALNVTFGDRVIIRPAEIATIEDLRQHVPLRQRLHVLLKGGARSRTEIADEFNDVKADSVRRTLDREIKAGRIVRLSDTSGTEQYGIAMRQS